MMLRKKWHVHCSNCECGLNKLVNMDGSWQIKTRIRIGLKAVKEFKLHWVDTSLSVCKACEF